jgi:hypothetical protein
LGYPGIVRMASVILGEWRSDRGPS